HEFSGGQKQRIMIAMALALGAELIVADEPTTALDVTVQAEILALLRDIRERHGTSIIVITHNMGVVADLADSVAVMYRGKIIERAGGRELFADPREEDTQKLRPRCRTWAATRPGAASNPPVGPPSSRPSPWSWRSTSSSSTPAGWANPPSAPSRGWTSRSAPARCTGWWASPVPGRPPSVAPSPGSNAPPAAASACSATRCTGCGR